MKYLSIFILIGSLCISCDLADSGSLNSGDSAISGSITKFKVVSELLYVIDGNDLRMFSLADPLHPLDGGTIEIGFGPETLFSLGEVLFVGAQTGMYMYSILDPTHPTLLSHYEHVLTCDPVVANSERAYVTLRSGNDCAGRGLVSTNQLHTIDISDKQHPVLISAYWMEHPKGLGLDGEYLFVCDGTRGIVVFLLDDHGLPIEQTTGIPGFEAIDVIAHDHLLIVVTRDQILQFDYSDINEIRLLSSIEHGA